MGLAHSAASAPGGGIDDGGVDVDACAFDLLSERNLLIGGMPW